MRLAETVLSLLSVAPCRSGLAPVLEQDVAGKELSVLRREFPDLSALVHGKKIVDFGCGVGNQATALVADEQCTVLGLDTNETALQLAQGKAAVRQFGDRLQFASSIGPDFLGQFDVVISQNAMEHYPDPQQALLAMASLLRHPGGMLLLTFGPPWWAPYGSHMHFFTRVPWVNLLFSEKTVMKVRSRFRTDGATRYQDVESGLNKMSIAKFERLVQESGLVVERCRYRCVKGLQWLQYLPGVRELFINHVSCLLRVFSNGGMDLNAVSLSDQSTYDVGSSVDRLDERS